MPEALHAGQAAAPADQHGQPAQESPLEQQQGLEPHLLVPASLTQRALAALKSAGAIPTHWQRGGRYGSRIAAELRPPEGQRARRTIPVLPTAAKAISAFLAAAAPTAAAQSAALPAEAVVELPSELQAVLSAEAGVALEYLPLTPARVPRSEAFDATVHPERTPATPATPAEGAAVCCWHSHRRQPPERPAFKFAELFAGIGVTIPANPTLILLRTTLLAE